MWDYDVTENHRESKQWRALMEAQGSATSHRFFEGKNSGMYIVFIVRLNNTVLASFEDRLVSDNLFAINK